MKSRILVIDDDAEVLEMTAMTLEDAEFDVVTAVDGREGLDAHQDQAFDGIVSDVNMPKVDGFTLCRTLREAGDTTPLLLLTARDGEIDEALGLDLGADDYLIKPFRSRVLVARVKAILRRKSVPTVAELVEDGPVQLDRGRLQIRFQGQLLVTTVTEFRLLDALVSYPGHVQSRSQLLEAARQDDSVVAPRIIDTYIRRLRRKFTEVDANFGRIDTVIGAGYRWVER